MRLLFRLLLVLLNYIGCLEAYAQVREFNLASETEWTLRIDGGEALPIIVPGGGWNSDLQTSKIHVLKDVYNYVDYEREIDIPLLYDNQNVILKFGAVNYGAEIYVDHSFVSTHAGSQIPFDIDITKFVKGKSNVHLLVRAYHRRYYDREGVNILPVGWEWPEGSSGTPWEWQSNAPDTLSKMGYGITKYIKMAVCPESFIEDVFIRPSVSSQSLSYDVWIHNGSSKDKTYTLSSVLSSWNNDNWTYPEICKKEFSVKAFSTEKISINNIPWTLGENSYWWPNIPFNESYQAKLHYLNFDLVSDGVLLHKHSQRFGFCEHSEGKYYYMVNNVRVNGLGDGTAENQMSYYDCYSTAPAFLPPTDSTLGCPESWKRYMRIGFNSLRLHCSLPTQYMMDVADELGLMLIPEAPIWGNNLCKYHSVYTPQTIKAMIKFCRNHPSVVRYSLTNEVR